MSKRAAEVPCTESDCENTTMVGEALAGARVYCGKCKEEEEVEYLYVTDMGAARGDSSAFDDEFTKRVNTALGSRHTGLSFGDIVGFVEVKETGRLYAVPVTSTHFRAIRQYIHEGKPHDTIVDEVAWTPAHNLGSIKAAIEADPEEPHGLVLVPPEEEGEEEDEVMMEVRFLIVDVESNQVVISSDWTSDGFLGLDDVQLGNKSDFEGFDHVAENVAWSGSVEYEKGTEVAELREEIASEWVLGARNWRQKLAVHARIKEEHRDVYEGLMEVLVVEPSFDVWPADKPKVERGPGQEEEGEDELNVHLHDKWIARMGAPREGDFWYKDDEMYEVDAVVWNTQNVKEPVTLLLRELEEVE